MEYYVKSVISIIEANYHKLTSAENRLERYGRPCHSGEDRRLIDRAKALLMDRHGITEEQAHYYLQKKSMDSRTKLAQTARLVLDSKTME